MPLRLDAFTKCWQTSELLILPFLAPRVFAPWPSRHSQRRANSSSQTKQRNGITGNNSDRLERKEAAVAKWLQKKLELELSPKEVNNEVHNRRCSMLYTDFPEGNNEKGQEDMMLERPSVRGRYLRQRIPPVRKVLSNRSILLCPTTNRTVLGQNPHGNLNSSNRVQFAELLTTPIPQKKPRRSRGLVQKFQTSVIEDPRTHVPCKPERPGTIVQKPLTFVKEDPKASASRKLPKRSRTIVQRYLSSVKEELKQPIGLPQFLRNRLYIRTVPKMPRLFISMKHPLFITKKKSALDLKSKIMFKTYFADRLTKRTHSTRIRRRSALIAKMKKAITKTILIDRATSKFSQERRIVHRYSSIYKPSKGQTPEAKWLKSRVLDQISSLRTRKGKNRKGKKSSQPVIQDFSNPQIHNQTSSVKSKHLGMLPPRKARRYIVQRTVVNALEARRKELRRLRKSHSRRPINTRQVTDWRQAWHRRFSLIQPNHTGFMKAWIDSPRIACKFPIYRNSLPVRFKRYLAKLRSLKKLRDFWVRVPQPIRVKYWHDVMCFTLQRYPKAGLNLLVATYIKPYPAGYAVGNCIDFIISYYLGPYVHANPNSGRHSSLEINPPINWSAYEKKSPLPRQLLSQSPDALILSRLAAAVIFLSETGPRDVQINRGSQYLLVTTMDADSLENIYKKISNYWAIDHLFTIADRFAKAKKSVLALEVLRKLEMHPAIDFDSQRMHMLFSTFLRFNNRDDTSAYSDAMMWDHMTSRGLKPVTQHYNILIQNSFLRGESDTCWAIYNAMLEDGIAPDDFTHSILLTYSKSLMDRSSVQRTLGLAKAMNLQMNPFIATDHLHSIFLFYRQDYESDEDVESISLKDRPKAFEQMLPVYCKYFDPRPLALSIGPLAKQYPELNQPPLDMGELMEPPKQALTVMFIGLLYGFTEVGQVVEAYSHFRSLLSHGDPDLVARLHQSHIYDCFLMKFGKLSETVDKCPKVVEDMLTSSKSKLPSISRDKNEDFYLNLIPTVYTWNILLQVYASRGQMNAGRRVLEIMQERGIKPTTVTWATLATGYSWVQDIPGTLEAVDELAKLGFRDHPVGVHALNKIKDTRALYAIMEAREAKHQAKRASDGDGIALNAEDKPEKKDELAKADEIASERIQLIGEAVHDMERGSWQKRRYWGNVFRETSAAREAAGVQPAIPDSALDGSHFPQETVESATVSKKQDGNKIVNWTTLWNGTIGAHDFSKMIPSTESPTSQQRNNENGYVVSPPHVDEVITTTVKPEAVLEKKDETVEESAAPDEPSTH